MRAMDVMTTNVITVGPDTSVQALAMLLSERAISGVPVVDPDNRLVGIVSRANLVRALAMTKSEPPIEADSDDRTIRTKLLAELQGHEWVHMWAADIIVRDRVVHLWFSDDRSEEERQGVRVAAENIPGVHGVEEHIVPAPIVPSF